MKKKTLPRNNSKASGKRSVSKGPNLGERLIAAAKEMRAIEDGTALPARRWEIAPDGKGGFTRRLLFGDPPVFKARSGAELALAARKKLGLSQGNFAALLGVAAATLRNWEQGRREPDGAARVLLAVAAKEPTVVLEAAKEVRTKAA